MKLQFSILIASCLLLSSLSIYANPFPKCALGETCVLENGSLNVDITIADGTTFQCIVTADTAGSLNFNVKGGGRFNVTEGEGSYTANSTVTVNLVGEWKTPQPTTKGFIQFNKIKGTPGTVVCSPV